MRRAKTAIVAAAGIAVLLLAGCGGTVAEPTADEQFAQAEELYFAYREATNGVLALNGGNNVFGSFTGALTLVMLFIDGVYTLQGYCS